MVPQFFEFVGNDMPRHGVFAGNKNLFMNYCRKQTNGEVPERTLLLAHYVSLLSEVVFNDDWGNGDWQLDEGTVACSLGAHAKQKCLALTCTRYRAQIRQFEFASRWRALLFCSQHKTQHLDLASFMSWALRALLCMCCEMCGWETQNQNKLYRLP